MEKAIYISDIQQLKKIKDFDFERLYFGTEFCDHLIPPVETVRKILLYASDESLRFSFVSPICSDSGIERLGSIFNILPSGCEVIFNDWGVLYLLNKYFRNKRISLSLGRALVGQYKDPRLVTVKNSLRKTFFKKCNLNNPDFQDFLKNQNITRVELDNVYQGYNFKAMHGLKASLYYPYIFIAATTKCLFKIEPMLRSCKSGCKTGSMMIARLKPAPDWIITRGNAEFYLNNSYPAFLRDKSLGFDREVFMPSPGY